MNSWIKSVVIISIISFSSPLLARSIFTVAPNRNTVQLAANSTTNLTTTVTNGVNQQWNNIQFNDVFVSGSSVTGQIIGGTCVNGDELFANASCTIITQLTRGNDTTDTVLYPRFCASNGVLCSKPATNVTVTASATSTSITGTLTAGLPQATAQNTDQTVTFTFTNGSSSAAVAGVYISVTPTTYISNISNTCGSSSSQVSLSAGASCTWTATFNPTAVGAHSLTATLQSDTASDVELETSTLTGLTYIPNGPRMLKCFLDVNTGSLEDCVNSGFEYFDSFNNNTEDAIVNAAGSKVYVSIDQAPPLSSNRSFINRCDIESDGCLISCSDTGARDLSAPRGISFQTASNGSTYLYAANFGADSPGDVDPVAKCSIDTDGDLSCGNAIVAGNSPTRPSDIAFNSNGVAYISDMFSSPATIFNCTANSSGDLTCDKPSIFIDVGICPAQISFVNATTFYLGQDNISQQCGSSLYTCSADAATGVLASCTNLAAGGGVALSGPVGVSYNATDTNLLVANKGTNQLLTCAINGSSLGTCTDNSDTESEITRLSYLNIY
ncbi:MAG: hypothetical protein P1U63_05850 [Coxiellaceae bacterium]|nr:hypothetical protein [Coxiellaceae bacterium]